MKCIFILLLSISASINLKAQPVADIFSKIKAVTIRLKPGDDLKQKLEGFVKDKKIKAACIITCVGSLQQSSIRFANLAEPTTLPGKFEIVSLAGMLGESGLHLHISVSDSTGKTFGGHLMPNSIVYTTAEIIIGILPGVTYAREVDSTFGYKELKVRKRTKKR